MANEYHLPTILQGIMTQHEFALMYGGSMWPACWSLIEPYTDRKVVSALTLDDLARAVWEAGYILE